MTSRLGPMLAAVAFALLLAGCSGAPAAPSPTVETTPTPTAAETTPTPTVTASPAAPTDDDGDTPHEVPDLDAMLPDVVLSLPVSRFSMSGDAAIEELNLAEPLLQGITAAGRSPSEIEVAVGEIEEPSLAVIAMRVPGLDASTLRTTIVEAVDPATSRVEEGQIGGKPVTRVGESQFIYARDDVLFVVIAQCPGGCEPRDIDLAIQTISQLP